jgi:hypothetical protein
MAASEVSLGNELLALGWKCGAVVPAEASDLLKVHIDRQQLVHEAAPRTDHWFVVLSQTCDVVARTLEQEPLVEILRCVPVKKMRKGRKNLESTRYIDFMPDQIRFPGVFLAAHATGDRFTIPRGELRAVTPDATRCLSERAVALLQRWYALRYSRPAWPDELTERLAMRRERLLDALAPLNDDRSEMRVQIKDPLAPDGPYTLAVFLVVDETVWTGDAAARSIAIGAFGAFVAALSACNGIKVDEISKPINGGEFSWQLSQETDVWNFAQLTVD